jgi:hypothetical protein
LNDVERLKNAVPDIPNGTPEFFRDDFFERLVKRLRFVQVVIVFGTLDEPMMRSKPFRGFQPEKFLF